MGYNYFSQYNYFGGETRVRPNSDAKAMTAAITRRSSFPNVVVWYSTIWYGNISTYDNNNLSTVKNNFTPII